MSTDRILLITVLAGIAVFFAGRWLYGALRDSLAVFREFTASLRKFSDHMESIPKYLNGVHQIAVENVAQVKQLTDAVEAFKAVVLRDPEEPDDRPYNETADLEYKKQRYMAEGLTESDAEVRVETDEAARLLGENPTL